MIPFLTGSHAYGTPTPTSDIDICVLMDEKDLQGLQTRCNCTEINQSRWMAYSGKLNLIVFLDPAEMSKWYDVTQQLIAEKPVTREQAIAAFNAVGLTGYTKPC